MTRFPIVAVVLAVHVIVFLTVQQVIILRGVVSVQVSRRAGYREAVYGAEQERQTDPWNEEGIRSYNR
jgi:hypothetical protein